MFGGTCATGGGVRTILCRYLSRYRRYPRYIPLLRFSASGERVAVSSQLYQSASGERVAVSSQLYQPVLEIRIYMSVSTHAHSQVGHIV